MIVNIFVVIQLLQHSVQNSTNKLMVKALLKYLLCCRVLTFQCLALSLNSGWCQVKKVGDLHQLCIGKFTGWCPQNNPALKQGQQDTSWKPGMNDGMRDCSMLGLVIYQVQYTQQIIMLNPNKR
jgi:hypothetical protein